MTDTVLDLIDGALAACGDAMRWSPEPETERRSPYSYAALFNEVTSGTGGAIPLTAWQAALLDQLPTTVIAAGFYDPYTSVSVTPLAGVTAGLVVVDEVASYRARRAARRRVRLSRMHSMYRKRSR